MAPDKLDGQVVGWAAGGTGGANAAIGWIGAFPVGPSQAVMAWSPDFGDYWADITPRVMVQDFAFESSTILYILQMNGVVQKMPYTGTAWASSLNSVSTKGSTGHTIEAMAPDKVLTGQSAGSANTNVMSLSTDGGVNYAPMSRMPGGLVPSIGYHVLFDTDFTKNATVYIASDLGFGANGAPTTLAAPADTAPPQGLVYRNTAPAGSNTEWTDMMTNQFFIGYAGPHRGYYGIVQTNSKNVIGQGTLYAAHTIQSTAADTIEARMAMWSGVERTLSPLDGIPKPGIELVLS